MLRGKLVNGLKVLVNPEDGHSMRRKFTEMRRQVALGNGHARASKCWACDRHPSAWVREVIFDIAESGDPDMKTALVVNSDTYEGPVPGFCWLHLGTGPRELAEVVYNDSLIVAWGYRPARWFVVFTDGTRVQGRAIEIDPNPERAPITHDEHIKGAYS